MRSKLISPARGSEARPLVYRPLTSPDPAVRQVSSPPQPAESASELLSLRLRIAELEQSLPQQVAAARQAGFRDGESAGRSQAESATKSMLDRLGRSIHELAEWKPRLRKELEVDAVDLSVAMARRILRRELNIDPTALQGLIQVAFERMARNEITRVVVHPDHVAVLRETLASLTTRQIEIFADGAREKGALVFETTRGALDASVDTQLREIELGLADRLKWR